MVIETKYLRSDRTIEVFKIGDEVLYVYNNQGLYFDVFESEEKLHSFNTGKVCRGDYFFDNEEKLNLFLSTTVDVLLCVLLVLLLWISL